MREFDYPADDVEPENRINTHSQVLPNNKLVIYEADEGAAFIQSDAWIDTNECL